MRFRSIYFLLFIVNVYFIAGCTPEIDKNRYNANFFKGNANFTRYVNVGSNLGAGFMDNELFLSGQQNSLANILAQQFESVGGGRFKQPLMFDDLGFGNRLKLSRFEDCRGDEQLFPVPFGGTPDNRNTQRIATAGPFNNVSVPNAKVTDLNAAGYAQRNAYYNRFATSSISSSIMDEAALVDATFFTLAAGEADILDYATNGADQVGQANLLTISSVFNSDYETTVRKLISNGAKGALINIPKIGALPFFTTIPFDALELTAAQAAQLNLVYTLNNNVSFKAGKNPFVIRDGLNIRQLLPNEYVLLTLDLDSVKCGNYGSLIPLADRDVLTLPEIQEIITATNNYNNFIASMAVKYGLALFDLNAFADRLSSSGLLLDGVNYSAAFVSGGFYSLDGLQPTPRGNAILCNEIINVINKAYNSRVPMVDVNQYKTVAIP